MNAIATANTNRRTVSNERLSRLGLLQEPAGYVDGQNLYEYVQSNPIALVDPLGLQAAASQPANGLSGYQGAVTVKVDDGEITIALRTREVNKQELVWVVVQSKTRCDQKVDVIQFVHRIFGNYEKAKFRNHNGDIYDSTTDPKAPNYRTDNYAPGSPYVSLPGAAKDRARPPVVRRDKGDGTYEFMFYDGPGFTPEAKDEKAIFDDFVLYGGKIVYQLHWERWKKADGSTSYPADQAWGKPATELPDWATKTLERDKLPMPGATTQPAQ
jgi:hypothetical protein